MNLDKATQALEQAFHRDIEDGTIEVRREPYLTVVDGGNWMLTVPEHGPVGLDLPMNDARYYDEDTDAFLENVIGLEAEQSLATVDRALDGALSANLRETPGDVWSIRFGERLAKGVDTNGTA